MNRQNNNRQQTPKHVRIIKWTVIGIGIALAVGLIISVSINGL